MRVVWSCSCSCCCRCEEQQGECARHENVECWHCLAGTVHSGTGVHTVDTGILLAGLLPPPKASFRELRASEDTYVNSVEQGSQPGPDKLSFTFRARLLRRTHLGRSPHSHALLCASLSLMSLPIPAGERPAETGKGPEGCCHRLVSSCSPFSCPSLDLQ